MQNQNQSRPKKARFSKVRTGCLTCKERRVKCDEAKPTCQRCKIGKWKCKGFVAPPKPWLFEPEMNSSSSSTPNFKSSTSQTTVSQYQSYPNSGTYWRFTSHHQRWTAPETYNIAVRSAVRSKQSEPPRMLIPVIQSHGTPEEARGFQFFIETCAVQISNYYASYYWTILLPQASWQQPAVKQSLIAVAYNVEANLIAGHTVSMVRQRALRHYNIAIQCLLKNQPPLEIVLMTCSLLWVCESVSGASAAAKTHLESALKMLDEWRSSKSFVSEQWRESDSIIADTISPTYDALAEWSRTITTREKDGYVLSHVKLPLARLKTRLTRSSVPFAHFHEAANVLSAVIQRLIEHGEKGNIPRDAPTASASQEEIRQLLTQWYSIYRITPFDEHSAFVRTMLAFHHLTVSTAVGNAECAPFPDAHLLRQVFGTKHVRVSVHFQSELGLIPPLFMIGRHATIRKTRRTALEILKALQRVEGLWDSDLAAAVLTEVQDIEDKTDRGRLVDLEPYGKWQPSIDVIDLELRGELKFELWMTWTWKSRSGPEDDRQNKMRLQCTPDALRRLRNAPKHAFDMLVRHFGYQSCHPEEAK